MERKITFLIFLVIFAGYYHSPAEARGGFGRGARGLARGDQIVLENRITRSSDNIDQVVNETHVNEMTRITCERRYNESIEALTASLPHPNATSSTNNNSTAKNNTALIEKWTLEAEKNETACLTSGPHSGAYTVGFSLISYGLCSAFYFGFISVVSPVFFV